MTIDSSGNVGIGTSSPTQQLTIEGAMNLRNGSRAGAFEIDSSGNLWMGTATTAGSIIFESGHTTTGLPSTGVERARIDSDGLKFNGDTAAANALDDYEEGTWAPTVAGAATAGSVAYSYQNGYYTKIGRLVYVWFDLEVSSFSGGAGGLTITSFPFPAANLTNGFPTFQPWSVASAYASTYTTPTGIINPNGSVLNLYSTDDEHANFAAMNVNQTGRISGYVVMQTA